MGHRDSLSYSILSRGLGYSPTTKATYCLAADEDSFGSINKQVSLKRGRKKK